MNPAALEELTLSIKSQGILQPILVRQLTSIIVMKLLAGERRWRAATAAGLTKIPCNHTRSD